MKPAEEFINKKFKTIGLVNPNSYPVSFTRDVVIRIMEEFAQSQIEKERALTIGESFAIEDENSIQYFVQGIDGLKSSMIHTKLKPKPQTLNRWKSD